MAEQQGPSQQLQLDILKHLLPVVVSECVGCAWMVDCERVLMSAVLAKQDSGGSIQLCRKVFLQLEGTGAAYFRILQHFL